MKLGDTLRSRRRGAPGSASSPARREGGRKKGMPPGSWRLAGRLALLAVVAFGGGYVVATRVIFPPPPPPGDMVEVPEVVGLSVEGARASLADAGLELGSVEGLRHPGIDSGLVVGQGPLGGQLSTPGGAVRVTVSLGPLRQTIPDVARLRGDRALRVLEASGFRVGVDSADSDLPAGAVVGVDPAPGTVLAVPGSVRLTLSRGPSLVQMPYLLGIAQTQALDSLAVLGLSVAAVDTVFRFGRDQGLVVEQTPPADSLLPRGSRVRLSVGRGGGG